MPEAVYIVGVCTGSQQMACSMPILDPLFSGAPRFRRVRDVVDHIETGTPFVIETDWGGMERIRRLTKERESWR